MKELKPRKKLLYFELNKDNLRGQRIGQFIWNALNYSGYWEVPEGNFLFFLSDKDLVKAFNKYIKKYYGK